MGSAERAVSGAELQILPNIYFYTNMITVLAAGQDDDLFAMLQVSLPGFR